MPYTLRSPLAPVPVLYRKADLSCAFHAAAAAMLPAGWSMHWAEGELSRSTSFSDEQHAHGCMIQHKERAVHRALHCMQQCRDGQMHAQPVLRRGQGLSAHTDA